MPPEVPRETFPPIEEQNTQALRRVGHRTMRFKNFRHGTRRRQEWGTPEGEKLCDIFDVLFGSMATNGVTRYVLLDDIMDQPEMRPYLVQDLLEEVRARGLGLYTIV